MINPITVAKPEVQKLTAIRDKRKFISWLASNPDNFMQDANQTH